MDEVMHGTRVEESNELLIADSDIELHCVVGADPRNGM
jgi:hypothetical protein